MDDGCVTVPAKVEDGQVVPPPESTSQKEATASMPASPPVGQVPSGEVTSSGASIDKNATTASATEDTIAAPRPPAASVPKPIDTPKESNKAFSLAEANEELAMLLECGKVSMQEVSSLQGMMRDYSNLKTKVEKLKSLLGRSAKAQREAKVDLDATQKRLEGALREIDRLNQKVQHLQTRPSHMELLADFETRFDKLLLTSVGQSGGQDTAAPVAQSTLQTEPDSAVDSMLMEELTECRARIAKLESLNSALVQRSAQLEADAKHRKRDRDAAAQKIAHMELELRMAKMEAEHATRTMEEKVASLEEMQMEIDMVTKASLKANVRAAQGEAVAKSNKTDRQHIHQLESQVQALKEWALASAEAKRLAMERVSLLERKLKGYQGEIKTALSGDSVFARTVLSKSGSLVIGAGDLGSYIVELEEHFEPGTRLVLKWKFDATPNDCSTQFNIMKGKCSSAKEQSVAEYVIKDRNVIGGAAGESENVLSDNCCTLLWSNKKSWIRPRTVKFTVEVTCHD